MNTWGAVFATSFQGEISSSSKGYRRSLDRENPEMMDFQTQFDVASLTKIIFTTNMLMLSVDRNLLNLEDTVHKFLPGWKVADKERITVRNLLEHQSGLQPWLPLYVRCKTADDAFDVIAQSRLTGKPGDKRVYSDLGFIALGQILSSIYGSSLENIFEKELKPELNLKSTQFAYPIQPINVAATSAGDSYEMNMISSGVPYKVPEEIEEFGNWRNHILSGEINDGNSFHLFKGVSSHAGLFSDATDLINLSRHYLDAYAQDGVFSSKTLRLFLETSSDSMQCVGFRTWSIPTKNGDVLIYGHTGFTGVAFGFSTELNFSAVMLTNRLHSREEFVKTEELWVPFLENSLSKIL
jgi:CubicO group peptidase (beta-lactamase class C family)